MGREVGEKVNKVYVLGSKLLVNLLSLKDYCGSSVEGIPEGPREGQMSSKDLMGEPQRLRRLACTGR